MSEPDIIGELEFDISVLVEKNKSLTLENGRLRGGVGECKNPMSKIWKR